MKSAPELFSELQQVGTDKDGLKSVGGDILETAFALDSIPIQYRTQNPELNVGESTVDPSQFVVDGVRVQNVGMNAGAKVDIRASYYDRAAETELLTSPQPDLSPGSEYNGAVVTVNATVSVTIDPNVIEGDGMVLFTEGYD